MIAREPVFWSDFDGTAVEKLSKTNPRNWSKYPLAMMEGYPDFLEGVRDAGLPIKGVVTIRKKWLRAPVTNRSIREHGLDQYFPDKRQVQYKGNEDRKAGFVARQSHGGTVGMIDDKPLKFGMALLMNPDLRYNPGVKNTVVLGAVATPKQEQHVEELAQYVTEERRDLTLTRRDSGLYIGTRGLDGFGVHVVPLEPYSYEAGQNFAEHVKAA